SAVLKNVSWETDSFGFRNHPIGELSKVDIIVGGDSCAVGTSLSQDETLSEILSRKTGKVVYNLGGVKADKIPDYLSALKLKPRFFVFVIIERSLGELPDDFNSKKNSQFQGEKLAKLYQRAQDNITFNPFQSYKSKHGIFDSLLRIFIPLTDQDIAPGPYEFKNGFLQGAQVEKIDRDQVVRSAVRRLAVYRKFFADQGIRFVVVGVPNKETIYFDQVPLKHQPLILPMLQAELRSQGIEYIDLFQNFNSKYKESGALFHHPDDTHWNEAGVSIAADLLYETIKIQL
ncbi:MAG TPA: hypothetical protein VIG33_03175, partial [Pseudobdellovibrionaceae bacterium]